MSSDERDAGLMEAARLFSVLAEPARLKIIELLRDGSMCGRELATNLNLTPATTCHHLERLKLAKLLSERRAGRHVYYSISESDFARTVKQSLDVLTDGNMSVRQPPIRKSETKNRSKRRSNKKPKERL